MRRLGSQALCLLGLWLLGCAPKGCSREQQSSEQAALPSSVGIPSASVVAPAVEIALPAARYGVTALAHLPKGCSVAGRVEWKALVNHPLLAAVLHEALHPEPADVKTEEQRSFLTFLQRANLEPQRDVEQIAFCYVGAPEPMVIVAGALPKDLVELMGTLAPKGERYRTTQQAGVAVLTRAGRNLVQADDRALVMGSNLEQVLAARQLGSAYSEYAIPDAGEIAFVATGELLKGAFAVLLQPPFGQLAQRAERVEAKFQLANQELTLTMSLPSPEEAEVLKSGLSAMVSAQATELGAAAPNAKNKALLDALRAAASSARWSVVDKTLSLRVTVPLGALGLALALK